VRDGFGFKNLAAEIKEKERERESGNAVVELKEC